jgi:hypothetical protein
VFQALVPRGCRLWAASMVSLVREHGLSPSFYYGAKEFEISAGEGSSVLRLQEKRKGYSHVAFLGSSCTTGWLSSSAKGVVCNSDSKDFIKSFREGSKVTIAQRGSNASGRFFEGAGVRGGWPEKKGGVGADFPSN